MIQTIKAIICDWCNHAIDYFEGSNTSAEMSVQENDAVVVGGKHFCDDVCYTMFRKNG